MRQSEIDARFAVLRAVSPDSTDPNRVHIVDLDGAHPATQIPAPGSGASLVIASSSLQFLHPRRVGAIALRIAQLLTPSGIGFITARPVSRAQLRWALRRAGIDVESMLLPMRSETSALFLVPLHPSALNFAVGRETRRWRWLGRLLCVVVRYRLGRAMLRLTLPNLALVVRPEPTPRSFEWFSSRCEIDVDPSATIASVSWKQDGSVMLYGFRPNAVTPSIVAKVAFHNGVPNGLLRREADSLRMNAVPACSAGARIPAYIVFDSLVDRDVLIQTFAGGTPAVTLLRDHPEMAGDILERISSWLEQWWKGTVRYERLASERLHDEILTPVQQLLPLINAGSKYYGWLAERCMSVTDINAPLVTVHNDLTMQNVLIDSGGSLAIVDWESCRVQGLPLLDFDYAATDAMLASRRFPDRLSAFRGCFVDPSTTMNTISRLRHRLASSINVSDEFAELCVHACWIHHAFNEQFRSGPPADSSFLAILNLVASSATRRS
jgi:hypothetical protein